LAPESIFIFYESEMDQQVNNSNDQLTDCRRTTGISWQSLPEYPDSLPEMDELLDLFAQAELELKQIKDMARILNENLYAAKQPEWLLSEEVVQILRISKRTLQNYRDTGIVVFTRLKGKIYYNRKTVMALLEGRH